MMNCRNLFWGVALLLFAACTQDAYEKGTGIDSYVQADFVEAHANADKKMDYAVTDEDQRLTMMSLRSASWMTKADTIYRAILYYEQYGALTNPVRLSKVSVAHIIHKDSVKSGIKTDPLTLESVWVSTNKRYLNVGFYLKTGSTSDDEAMQLLAVIGDTLMTNADNTHTLWLRLYHDQGGVPEYYSTHSYFSLPLQDLTADSIRLTVNTYQGEVVKTLSIH